MAELFDDISRMVGSRMPRRELLKLTAGAIGGGVLAALWPSRLRAQQYTCGSIFDKTGNGQSAPAFTGGCTQAMYDEAKANAIQDSKTQATNACSADCHAPVKVDEPVFPYQWCENDPVRSIAHYKLTYTYTCCAVAGACKGDTVCCPDGTVCAGGTVCCPTSRVCNNNTTCCPEGQVCTGTTCCSTANACGSACCGTGTFCCGRGASLCCANGKYCCGGVACCDTQAQCCGYNSCCTPTQYCCNGKCCNKPCGADGSCPSNPSPSRP